MAIGLIAEHYLTPSARQEVRAILHGKRLSDREVASWADEIRGNKAYEQLYPGNAKWHYVNFDVATPSSDLHLPKEGHDVVDQVTFWQQELADRDCPEPQRLDGLRFLEHFVGDLHQPLHCAFRDGDCGGNLVPVHSFRGAHYTVETETAIDRPPNLHSTWDESLVREAMGGASMTSFVARLLADITSDKMNQWNKGDPYQWAVQTHQLAVAKAYRFTDGSAVPKSWKRPGVDLTKDNYIDANLPFVQEQLEKAGVRLAFLINTALSNTRLPDQKSGRGRLSRAVGP